MSYKLTNEMNKIDLENITINMIMSNFVHVILLVVDMMVRVKEEKQTNKSNGYTGCFVHHRCNIFQRIVINNEKDLL
jgi:hypothetical protein